MGNEINAKKAGKLLKIWGSLRLLIDEETAKIILKKAGICITNTTMNSLDYLDDYVNNHPEFILDILAIAIPLVMLYNHLTEKNLIVTLAGLGAEALVILMEIKTYIHKRKELKK